MSVKHPARRATSFPLFAGLALTAWAAGLTVHFCSPRSPEAIVAGSPSADAQTGDPTETVLAAANPAQDAPLPPLPAAVPMSLRSWTPAAEPPAPVRQIIPVPVTVVTKVVQRPKELPPGVLAALGRETFLREWLPCEAGPGESDGLGPLYNDTSCVGCHNLGGAGGAGPATKNVVLRTQSRQTLLVHHFGTSSKHSAWRDQMLGRSLPRPSIPGEESPMPATVPAHPVEFSERNTPALFGAGLIDAIPDAVLLEIEQRSKKLLPSDAGEIPPGRPGRKMGRFGWKGQTASLAEFTAAACAAELGLHVPGHIQPLPMYEKAQAMARGLDLSDEEFQGLVAYVRKLPAPVQRIPRDTHDRGIVDRGRARFEQIGCAACHLPKVGEVEGIYSDLLVHEMGQELHGWGTSSSYGSGGFRGGCKSCGEGPSPPIIAGPTEWRTPPLWGCRDSAPYLHDGRAETLEKAIALHGGQANRSAEAFKALSDEQRFELVSFLKSLVAPE